MKKIIAMILIILLIFIVGCGAKQADPQSDPNKVTPSDNNEPDLDRQIGGDTVPTPSSNLNTDLAEAENKLAQKLTKGTQVVLSDNTFVGSRSLKVGNKKTIALGITNTGTLTSTFIVKIDVERAYDLTGNTIIVDDDTLKSWFDKAEYSQFILASGEQEFLPIEFTVGNSIKPGKATPSGTYTFDFQVYIVTSKGFENEFGGEQTLSIQIK
ncbi:hypothetical protein ACFL1H_04425 [Nanoarchaeota archaeon]